MEAVLARRNGAFERLVQQHQRLVWHVVQRMVMDAEDTRELSQEVFLRVYQKLHQFRFDCSLASWIGRIAFSIATRHLQRRRIPMEECRDGDDASSVLDGVADDVDLEAEFERADTLRHVQSAMQCLSPVQRTLLTLYHADELPIAEIVNITGQPEGTVKNSLFRARQRLRMALQRLIEVPV
ncbi:MAG: sigma-70 family RNA polymerase sigma factor [Lysobacteraceae bacterium]